MIVLDKVTKTYALGGETIYALNNVSLTIKTGEFIAIVGPSGSGKSTLANLIGGLDTPDSGTITVDDENLADANDADLSRYRNKKIGFVFQTFNLHPHYTALENVAVPLVFAGMVPQERSKRAKQCLAAVGLADRIQHKPNQLSGGQRQRVSIARALANHPSLIIADEPTGNLDSKKSLEIMTLLRQLQTEQTLTLLVITHDPAVAKLASRTITIQDGKVR